MIERIIEYSVRNPLIVILVALAVAGWGAYSLLNTPVDAIPDLSENQVIVFADWSGRSPKEVEDQVTYPLSVNLQGLAGVKSIRATSEFGFSMINIIFDDDVDFYFACERVLERLSIAGTFLPQGVAAYLAPDATALGQIFWYTVEGEGYDLGRLRAVQDWFVRYQLYSVDGVAEVASVGGFPIEYQVDVDPDKLRAHNVTLGELYSAVARANSSVGGRVLQKGRAEYLIRSVGWIESLDDLEKVVIKSVEGTPVTVGQIASVQFGSAIRRAVLEKNGNEAVGGVVLMRYGENPLEVTQRIKDKIAQLQPGLPEGVRIVPFYDRTRLINDAVETVSHTVMEEMLVASAMVLLILWHVRSALIVCITLPMAVLVSFILMRWLDIPSNIMSLSGIAISIGVLVDSAIVMVENATHQLYRKHGDTKVRGDTTEVVLPAMRTVGRPIFFSVLIMVISFIPVFALGGMEGRMFRPLAFTKTFAMIGVAILAITLVPALVPLLIRGRVRGEHESWLVRSVIAIYRPVLNFLLSHPWPIFWVTSLIFIPSATQWGTAIGLDEQANEWLFRIAVGVMIAATFWSAWSDRVFRHQVLGGLAAFSLALLGLVVDRHMEPLGREFMPPLNEGTAMDMPVTIPRASITQVADDLKARDAILRTFPEVESVVGKAGRAETPTDPAPPDMIETIINFRPREHWPKRKILSDDAIQTTRRVLEALEEGGIVPPAESDAERDELVNDVAMAAIPEFDTLMRKTAYRRNREFETELEESLTRFAVEETIRMLDGSGRLTRSVTPREIDEMTEEFAPQFGPIFARSLTGPDVTRFAEKAGAELVRREAARGGSDLLVLRQGRLKQLLSNVGQVLGRESETFFGRLHREIESRHDALWREHVRQLNWELFDLAVPGYTWLSIQEILERTGTETPEKERLAEVREPLEERIARALFLWRKEREDLAVMGGEMDTLLQVPGWGNIWTQPIINRVDMLATGVRTMIGVKVFGDDLYKIQRTSQEIAAVLKKIPGAADVFPDQIVGESYLEIDIDRDKAARYGINVGDVQDVIETALGGKVITMTVEGRERFPIRVRYARDFREDEESVKNLLITAGSMTATGANDTRPEGAPVASEGSAPEPAGTAQIPLSQLADVRIVEGPSMIKSENGLLRSYVQLNVRDRDIVGFVEEAQRAVADQVELPAGMYIEWSGQFEHQLRARRTLSVIVPAVVLIIFVILYVTYNDLADALLMMLAVPGAIAGGVLFQYLFGHNFSVAVYVGFIACFGLATESGVVMLVYLREAIAEKGGLETMTLPELRSSVMDGAVHRLRPKLLTEATTIIGLAPMIWASGTGAEIMQPMAAPVLGGVLVADEVIDLLLPVLFYRVRRRRWERIHGRPEAATDSPTTAEEAVSGSHL